jgi:hypothetical protein
MLVLRPDVNSSEEPNIAARSVQCLAAGNFLNLTLGEDFEASNLQHGRQELRPWARKVRRYAPHLAGRGQPIACQSASAPGSWHGFLRFQAAMGSQQPCRSLIQQHRSCSGFSSTHDAYAMDFTAPLPPRILQHPCQEEGNPGNSS